MTRHGGFTRRYKRHGFTLIEVALVLGITGLVIGGIWYAAAKVKRSAATNVAADQLYQIVENVRAVYNSRPGIFTDNTAAPGCGVASFNSRLSCQGAFPVDLTGGAGNFAFHAWDRAAANGSVQIEPVDNLLNNGASAAPGVSSFGVRYVNLPTDVCTVLAAQHSTPDERIRLKAMIFRDNGGAVSSSYTTLDWGGALTLPVSPSAAAAACQNAAGVGNTATLEWVFMLR